MVTNHNRFYKRERKLTTWKRCECGDVIHNVISEKRRSFGDWPMQVKSVGICECGMIHWKEDLTNFAKEDYREYLEESEKSRKEYLKSRRKKND